MPLQIERLEIPDGVNSASGGMSPNGALGALPTQEDRVVIAALYNVASGASGSTTTATVAITLDNLPANYGVFVTTSGNCFGFVAANTKTNSGFTVTLQGNASGDVPANATFDLLVIA